jgi:hypothetical protein
VRALVGGFDSSRRKQVQLRHAGMAPARLHRLHLSGGAESLTRHGRNDALFFRRCVTGDAAVEPKNYDGGFEGLMSLRITP